MCKITNQEKQRIVLSIVNRMDVITGSLNYEIRKRFKGNKYSFTNKELGKILQILELKKLITSNGTGRNKVYMKVRQ